MRARTRKLFDRSFTGLSLVSVVLVAGALALPGCALLPLSGARRVIGFNQQVMGDL